MSNWLEREFKRMAGVARPKSPRLVHQCIRLYVDQPIQFFECRDMFAQAGWLSVMHPVTLFEWHPARWQYSVELERRIYL